MKAQLHNLRRLFFRFNRREQWLIMLLCWVVAAILISITLQSWRTTRFHASVAETQWENQNFILEHRASITGALKETRQALGREESLPVSTLAGIIDRQARERRLDLEMGAPRTEQAEGFSLSTLRVTLRRASLDELIRFEQSIAGLARNVSLDQLRLMADSNNPALLDAQFVFTCLEWHDL